jgi:hypothetical protein
MLNWVVTKHTLKRKSIKVIQDIKSDQFIVMLLNWMVKINGRSKFLNWMTKIVQLEIWDQRYHFEGFGPSCIKKNNRGWTLNLFWIGLELWLANGDVCNASIYILVRQRQLRFTTKVVLRYEGEGTYKLKRLVLRDSSKCLNKKEKMCSTCKWIIAKRVTRSCLYWLGGSNRPRLWSGVRCRWQLISWMMIQRSREKETYVNCCGGAHWMSLGLACWMNFVRNRRKWILWIQWFFL